MRSGKGLHKYPNGWKCCPDPWGIAVPGNPNDNSAIVHASHSLRCIPCMGRAIGEFAAVVMIAYFPMVVSTLIYHRFTTGGLEESRSIAFIMLVVCLLVFLAFPSGFSSVGEAS